MRPVFAAALLLAACVSPAGRPVETTSAPAGVTRMLYLTPSVDGSGLVPIDPVSLRDLPRGPLVHAPAGEPNPCGGAYSGPCALVTASADARTLAVVGYSRAGAAGVSVFDARTGAFRSRAIPEVAVIVDALSSDGSRVYARAWPPANITAERVVLDASSGKVVEREPAIDVGGDPVALVVDDARRLMYALVVDAAPLATGPREARVLAWDLHSGRRLWRADLPSLLAGEWLTGRIGSEGEVRSRLVPGIALSPDGGTLAVVRAFDCCVSRGTLWLIDTADGKVRSERAYERSASLLEQLLAPSIAAAKEDEEVGVTATFGADGRVLYARAASWRPDGRAEPYQYLGMSAVEIKSAKVLGSDIKMEPWWFGNRVAWVRPSADGRWIYAFLERTGNADPKGYVLRRLDPRTLAVLAERRFDSYRYAFMLAAP